MRDRQHPEEQAFLAEVDAVVRACGPSSSDWHPDVWLATLAERGWGAPEWPARWGGAGLDPRRAFLLDRVLAETGAPRPDPETVDLAGWLIRTFGTQAQRDRFLPDLATGRVLWALHGSLRGGGPLPAAGRDGVWQAVTGAASVHAASAADWLLAAARDERSGDLALLAGAIGHGSVATGLPLDPDTVYLSDTTFELLGSPCGAAEFRASLTGALAACARTARCRTAALRRSVAALAGVAAAEAAMAHRLQELEVGLLATEAMERRAFLAAGRSSWSPDTALLGAVAIRTSELGAALAELAVESLGYHALPAPDPHRQHNELPDLAAGGAVSGADAIARLLRYVGGLDAMAARDRLAVFIGSGSDEG